MSGLREILSISKPFDYVVETDYVKCKRWTRAIPNEQIVEEVSLQCGEIIHDLQSALDHAYWQIVSPCVDESKRGRVQFPHSKTIDNWPDVVDSRQAYAVSQKFGDFIKSLNVCDSESVDLAFLHRLDVSDKHKFILPMGNVHEVDYILMQVQVHDFPQILGRPRIGMGGIDVCWNIKKVPSQSKRAAGKIAQRKIDVDIGVSFSVERQPTFYPVLPTLDMLLECVDSTVLKMFEVAST